MPATHQLEIIRSASYFPVPDVAVIGDYYRDVFGFQCEYAAGNPPEFAICQRGGSAIMFRRVPHPELITPNEKQGGTWGAIVGNVFTFVSERADLRAWQTLPATWQAARVFLPAGRHELRVAAPGAPACALGTFDLEPGETMFVVARTVGPHVYAYPIGGRRPPSEAPSAAPEAAATSP